MKTLAFFFALVIGGAILFFAGIGFARRTGAEAGKAAAEGFIGAMAGTPEQQNDLRAYRENNAKAKIQEMERLEEQLNDLKQEQKHIKNGVTLDVK